MSVDAPTSSNIFNLTMSDGYVHIVEPELKAAFRLKIRTESRKDGAAANRHVDISGRYANAPISGRFIGGSVLTLRDAAEPYPVDLKLQNGDTKVALHGTLKNPVAFSGARLKLAFRGNKIHDLDPLPDAPQNGRAAFRERVCQKV